MDPLKYRPSVPSSAFPTKAATTWTSAGFHWKDQSPTLWLSQLIKLKELAELILYSAAYNFCMRVWGQTKWTVHIVYVMCICEGVCMHECANNRVVVHPDSTVSSTACATRYNLVQHKVQPSVWHLPMILWSHGAQISGGDNLFDKYISHVSFGCSAL